jgi:two-component system, OmpR family, sensor histidine kinase KdpD
MTFVPPRSTALPGVPGETPETETGLRKDLCRRDRDDGRLARRRRMPALERAEPVIISSVRQLEYPREFAARFGKHPGPLAGLSASVAAVGLVTAVIALLDRFVPVLSLGVLYVFAVLPIAAVWGLAYSVFVSVACMLAFNFFFLPPLHTLTLADSRNWFALLVFVATAIVVSELAAGSRRRAREAALLAEIATSLLEHGTVGAELERISREAAQALHADSAAISLGDDPAPGYALTAGGRRVGTITLRGGNEGEGARRRLLPALGSLLGVAIDRERLEQEAVEAEALRRADAIKTALLRSVSHDLRTPLMAISTSAGALARPDLTIDGADRAELLATILAASNRLDQLVSALLDLSRLQAGAADPRRELIEVDDLVVAALDELGAAAGRVELSLPEEPPVVEVDAQQVQRALVNLIENALKYSPSDEPVRVQAAATPAEVVIRVVDHGRGVLPADRERIFEPFQRGEGGDSSSGAGLGLAIARGFAEANGGRLSVESRQAQGATFVLTLARATSSPPLRAGEPAPLGTQA